MATLIDTEGYGDQFVLTEDSLTVKVSTTVDGTLDAGNTTIDGTLSAGNTTINGNLITTGNANIGGTATWAASIVGTTKLFDIPHPTKDDMRLRHGCLEGPELGVYARGKTSEGIIPLPDYWSGLVDEKSITVQSDVVYKDDVFEWNITHSGLHFSHKYGWDRSGQMLGLAVLVTSLAYTLWKWRRDYKKDSQVALLVR